MTWAWLQDDIIFPICIKESLNPIQCAFSFAVSIIPFVSTCSEYRDLKLISIRHIIYLSLCIDRISKFLVKQYIKLKNCLTILALQGENYC